MLKSLSKDFEKLLFDEETADVTIRVNKDNEVTEFKAHSQVLIARSAPLRAMLLSSMKEGTSKELEIHNFLPKSVEKLLEFIYTASISVEDFDVVELFQIADFYQVHELQMYCAENVDMSTEELLKGAAYAFKYENSMTKILEKLDYITNELLLSTEFIENVSLDLYCYIIKNTWFLREVNELALFNAIVSWGNSRFKQSEMKEKLEPLLELIKFEFIYSKDIYDVILPLNLVNERVLFEALRHRFNDRKENYYRDHLWFRFRGNPNGYGCSWVKGKTSAFRDDYGNVCFSGNPTRFYPKTEIDMNTSYGGMSRYNTPKWRKIKKSKTNNSS